MPASERLDFATLDVFTTERYKGNPLAIVHLPREVDVEQSRKQAIACEFNLSETVFLHDNDDGSADRKIDIFLPTTEVPFAGHPTIGTIAYLCAGQPARSSPVRFTLYTKAGPIAASYNHRDGLATADIPHDVRIHCSSVRWKHVLDVQPGLSQGWEDNGQRVVEAWSRREDGSETTFPLVSIVNGMNFVLVDFPNVDEYLVRLRTGFPSVDPDVTKLDEGWSSSVIAPYYYVVLPEQQDETIRLRTRLIMTVVGEDPATGSAASALSSYLSLRKGEAGGKYTYEIEQGVEMGRPSRIGVQVTLDSQGKSVAKVLLSGTATPVMQGTLIP